MMERKQNCRYHCSVAFIFLWFVRYLKTKLKFWLAVGRTIHDYDVGDKTREKRARAPQIALYFLKTFSASISLPPCPVLAIVAVVVDVVVLVVRLFASIDFLYDFFSIRIFIITVASRDIYYRLRQIKYCTHEIRVVVAVVFRLLQTRPAAAERAEVEKCKVRVWRRVETHATLRPTRV